MEPTGQRVVFRTTIPKLIRDKIQDGSGYRLTRRRVWLNAVEVHMLTGDERTQCGSSIYPTYHALAQCGRSYCVRAGHYIWRYVILREYDDAFRAYVSRRSKENGTESVTSEQIPVDNSNLMYLIDWVIYCKEVQEYYRHEQVITETGAQWRHIYDYTNDGLCIMQVQVVTETKHNPSSYLFQMDSQSIKSLQTVSLSEKNGTILETGEQQVSADVEAMGSSISTLSMSYDVVSDLTNKWYPLHAMSFSTSHIADERIGTISLPRDILKDIPGSSIAAAFANYNFCMFDARVRLVVNSSPFQTGKIIMAPSYSSVGSPHNHNGLSAVQRDHVIIDISSKETGELWIPFCYHRALVTNFYRPNSDATYLPAVSTSVEVFVHSILRSGSASPNVDLRPFICLENLKLFGPMPRIEYQNFTHRVTKKRRNVKSGIITQEGGGPMYPPIIQHMNFQMDVVADVVASKALKAVIKGIDTPGRNRDMPTQIQALAIVPHPRLGFANGKTPVDATSLTNDPLAQMFYPYKNVHNTVLDIARIPGLIFRGEWGKSQAGSADNATTKLMSIDADPTTRSKVGEQVLTPLEYVAGMYMYWSGSIIYDIHFVATDMHTGSVAIVIEYGCKTYVGQKFQTSLASNYVTHHLSSTTKNIKVVVPYVYDTEWKQTQSPIYDPQPERLADESDTMLFGFSSKNVANVSMYVVNRLNCPDAVSSSIDILVYTYAGEDFRVHGIKPIPYELAYDTRVSPQEVPAVDAGVWRAIDIPSNIIEANEYKYSVEKQFTFQAGDAASLTAFMGGRAMAVFDDQTSIKDLLRRPINILHKEEIDATTTMATKDVVLGYMIPVEVPTLYKKLIVASSFTQLFTLNAIVSPQSAIMSLYRYWRGSVHFIVVVHDQKPEPVTIAYLPHTLLRKQGRIQVHHLQAAPRLLYGTGLITEIICPNINNTAEIRVPYTSENPWTLTASAFTQQNLFARDASETNAGHIVINSGIQREISVWWRAGDDFEVRGYMGTPKTNTMLYTHLRTAEPYFQMDESLLDRLSSALGNKWDHIKVVAPILGGCALAPFNPVMGAAVAGGTIASRVATTLYKVDDATSEMSTLINGLQSKSEDIYKLIHDHVNNAFQGLTGLCASAVTGISVVKNIVFDIIIAAATKSWIAVGIGMVRAITDMFGLEFAGIIGFGKAIGAWFERKFTCHEQADDIEHASSIGALAGIVAVLFRIQKFDARKYASKFELYIREATDGRNYQFLNTMTTFIKAHFRTFKEMIEDAFGIVDPQIASLQSLLKNRDQVEKFISEAQLLMSELNASTRLSPANRTRFWVTVTQAYQIQKHILSSPCGSTHSQLLMFCKEVIKFANDKSVDFSCCPERFVPFVLCIHGEPGIGKSTLNRSLVSELLDEVKYKATPCGAVYTIQPGSKFWNGYVDQPVVTFDDFMNITYKDELVTPIRQVYQLKSSEAFIPEMAALENKDRRANPLIVTMMTNDPYPTAIKDICPTTDAVLRRRDLVIHARPKMGWTRERISQLTAEEGEQKPHLEFQVHKSAVDQSAGYEETIYDWHGIVKFLRKYFHDYYDREVGMLKKRLQLYLKSCHREMPALQEVSDPFEVFYGIQSNVERELPRGWLLPSEKLKDKVQEAWNYLALYLPTTFQSDVDSPFTEDEKQMIKEQPNDEYKVWRIFEKLRWMVARDAELQCTVESNDNELFVDFPCDETFVFKLDKQILNQAIQIKEAQYPTCRHKHLIENVDITTYDHHTHKFCVPTVDGDDYIYLEVNACDNECPFADKQAVYDFYRKWTELNSKMLKRNMYLYCQDPEYNKSRMACVPLILQPSFIRKPIDPLPRTWLDFLHERWDKYKNGILIIGGVVAALATIIGALRVYTSLLAFTEQSEDMHSAKYAGKLKRKPGKVRSSNYARNDEYAFQSATNYVASDKIMRNMITITIWKDDKEISRLQAIGFKGKLAFMPKHYLARIMVADENNLKITVEPSNTVIIGKLNTKRKQYTYSPKDFVVIENTDIALFNLPKSFETFANIIPQFWTNADTTGYLPSAGQLLIGPTTRSAVRERDVEITGYKQKISVRSGDGSMVDVHDIISYDYAEDGICGALLLRPDHQRPIIAMHCAGNAMNMGNGVIITQEMLSQLAEDHFTTFQMEECDFLSMDYAKFELPDTYIKVVGVVEGEVPFHGTKSKIIPSAIQGKMDYKPKTEPVILSPLDERYTHPRTPLWYGVAKHGKQTIDPPTHVLHNIGDVIYNQVYLSMKPLIAEPHMLNLKEAVVGIPGIKYYDPIRLATSSGYPWSMRANSTTKEAWITPIRDDNLEMIDAIISDDVLAEIARKDALRIKGIQPYTLFTDTLKDERKEISKVYKEGGTRLFCASPLDYTLSLRQHFLHFTAAMTSARLKVGSAIGINCKGPEWTELFDLLVNISPTNIIQTDYSNFGPGFNACVHDVATDIIIRWTLDNVSVEDKDKYKIYLKTLLMECINSTHLATNVVYQQFAGSPSGSPDTSYINTIVNQVYLAFAWYEIMHTELDGHELWSEYYENVVSVDYGDDKIASVSDRYRDKFNTISIQAALGRYEIAITDAAKTENIKPFVHIFEAQFLKRGFKPHPTRPGMVLGPLSMVSVMDTTQWVWKSPNLKEATRVNCQSALNEAHGHGPDEFSHIKQEVNKALCKVKIKPLITTWYDLDDTWFKGRMPEYY